MKISIIFELLAAKIQVFYFFRNSLYACFTLLQNLGLEINISQFYLGGFFLYKEPISGLTFQTTFPTDEMGIELLYLLILSDCGLRSKNILS